MTNYMEWLANGLPFAYCSMWLGPSARLQVLGPRSRLDIIRTMVHSCYRYVTRRLAGNKSRSAPGWYVQDPGSRKLRGPYEDELAAATSIAKTLRVKMADLLRTPAPRSKVLGFILDGHEAVCKYKFVTKRVLRGKTYWVGQPTKGKQKMFTESLQAAKWTAKQRKITVKAMLKK